MSAQKALSGFETKKRVLLKGMKENSNFPNKGHRFAYQANKLYTTKSKFELVAQPDKGMLEKTRPWLNS